MESIVSWVVALIIGFARLIWLFVDRRKAAKKRALDVIEDRASECAELLDSVNPRARVSLEVRKEINSKIDSLRNKEKHIRVLALKFNGLSKDINRAILSLRYKTASDECRRLLTTMSNIRGKLDP